MVEAPDESAVALGDEGWLLDVRIVGDGDDDEDLLVEPPPWQ